MREKNGSNKYERKLFEDTMGNKIKYHDSWKIN